MHVYCLSYFDFRLPSELLHEETRPDDDELLLKRYEKYLVKKGFVIVVAVDACRSRWTYYALSESTN